MLIRIILCIFASGKINQVMEEDIRKETLKRVAHELAVAGQKQNAPLSEEQIIAMLEQRLMTVIPEVTEVRPQVLECDVVRFQNNNVVRFQNNKEKWVALVGLLDGYPYEIFTGLQDDEEGIMLPKTVTHGKIIKQVNPDGTKRYDFQFENKRGYKTTVEGLSEKFNPEYWNYAKLISGVLRYRMPLEHVIKLVASLSLKDESINTWKTGVERALKKYIPGSEEEVNLKDVRFHAFHGVMPQETKVGADFIVNLRIGYPLEQAIESDEVGDTLNYAEVYDLVKQEMKQPSKLLEHVAGRIVQTIGQHFPLVTSIDLTLMKQNPPMGADIEGAGVEIHLINDKSV